MAVAAIRPAPPVDTNAVALVEKINASFADPQAFFDANRFVAKRMADWLLDETPIAHGGQQLHVYRNGRYVADHNSHRLRARIAKALGERWSKSREAEALGYLEATVPELVDRPSERFVNCINGVLDRETGELGAHDPQHLTPVQLGAAFDPDAECPEILRFLESALPSQALRDVFIEICGLLITPNARLQVAFMFMGGGANGKSTALNLIKALLGPTNCSAIALHKLEDDRFAAAELYGKLANIFADLDARALSSSSVFKSITGGDSITAERKFRPSFTFDPFARLLLSANEPPPTPDGSDAFFRRWVIVPFEQSFKGREDRNLLARLTTRDELAGLLNLALARLPAIEQRGRILTSAETEDAQDRFRVDADPVAGFVRECCEIDPDARAGRPAVYEAYREWSGNSGRHALSRQKFNRRLEAHVGPDRLSVGSVQGERTWRGLRLVGGL